jgi:saccharopine dehydrogenase-like NADP-dependent oxidoreductase
LPDNPLYPAVRLEEGEHDITIFQVEAEGDLEGKKARFRVGMVDRYNATQQITSMARVTAVTGAMVARKVAQGGIEAGGWQTPEKLITGRALERLQADLTAEGVHFTHSDQLPDPQ